MKADQALRAIIIDVGNTRVRVAGWSGGSQDPRLAGGGGDSGAPGLSPVPTLEVLKTPDSSGAATLRPELAAVQAAYPELPVIVSGVVPPVVRLVQAVWPDAVITDHRSKLPFRLNVPEPAAIGPDRLCNVAVAAALGLPRALVVDAGTATTFDLLVDGEFIGGLIAPGMALAASCLTERTARLAAVPFAPCPLEIGRNTATAVQGGSFHTAVGGVEAVIDGLSQRYGPLTVVLTGGLAKMLPSGGRVVDRDWTLRGAAVLAGV